MFISFEGGEGSGKTTLIRKIYDTLTKENNVVIVTKAPGGSKTGELIRQVLLHNTHETKLSSLCELFLFLADRAQHVQEVILPALHQGAIVLCDRFNDSTVAYQGYARQLNPEKVAQLCLWATHHLEPDITFYLDIDPVDGLNRKHHLKDCIEKEPLIFHQQVRNAYLKIAEESSQRILLLNAYKPPEEVYQDAFRFLQHYRQSKS